jgi:hypothetical protein
VASLEVFGVQIEMHLLRRTVRPPRRHMIRSELNLDPPLPVGVDEAVKSVVLEDVTIEQLRPECALRMQGGGVEHHHGPYRLHANRSYERNERCSRYEAHRPVRSVGGARAASLRRLSISRPEADADPTADARSLAPFLGPDGRLLAPLGEHDGAMTRILVVANQTLGCPELEEALAPYTEGDAEMVVVAPISVSEGESQWDYPPIDRYIPSAQQIAHALAGGRLEHELARLKRLGVTARGEIVDHDPVGRVKELLRESEFDAVLVCTLPTPLSRWLRMDLPGRLARAAVTAPVVHVPGSAGPSL